VETGGKFLKSHLADRYTGGKGCETDFRENFKCTEENDYDFRFRLWGGYD